MPNMSVANLLDRMPEAFVSDRHIARAVSRAVKAGKLRKLASRLYTRNMADPPEAIVARNLWNIVAGYFPGALVADRTALENAPASDGSVCLITARGQDIALPGLNLRPPARSGTAPYRSTVSRRTLPGFDCARLSGEHASVACASRARGTHPSAGPRSSNG